MCTYGTYVGTYIPSFDTTDTQIERSIAQSVSPTRPAPHAATHGRTERRSYRMVPMENEASISLRSVDRTFVRYFRRSSQSINFVHRLTDRSPEGSPYNKRERAERTKFSQGDSGIRPSVRRSIARSWNRLDRHSLIPSTVQTCRSVGRSQLFDLSVLLSRAHLSRVLIRI